MPTEAVPLIPCPAPTRGQHLTFRSTPWPYVDAMKAMILTVMAHDQSTEQDARYVLAKRMGFSITTLARILDGRIADSDDTQRARTWGWPKSKDVVLNIATGFITTGAFPSLTLRSILLRLGQEPEQQLDLGPLQGQGLALSSLFNSRRPAQVESGAAPSAYIPTTALPTPAEVEATGEPLDTPAMAQGVYYLFDLTAPRLAALRDARETAPGVIKSQFSAAATPLLVTLEAHGWARLWFPFLPCQEHTLRIRVAEAEGYRMATIPVDATIILRALHQAFEGRANGVAAMTAPTTSRVTQEVTNELRILQTVVDDMGETEEIRAVVTKIKSIRVKLAS